MSRFRVPSLALTGVAGVTFLAGCSTGQMDTSSSPDSSIAPAESASSVYRDGEYEATGWYGNLPSHIDVAVTLEDDIVTELEVTPTAANPTSRELQDAFAEAIPGVVVGRPIAELHIDRLAGSSGTPQGFNDAIEQIRTEAAAP